MKKQKFTYEKSGVNINAADNFVRFISNISSKNKGKKMFSPIGGFGSISSIPKNLKKPKIVACTDGVGTKIEIANTLNKFDTIGIDLVAMCVNDLIVQGARPIFFLDYIAIGKLNLKKIKLILKGIIKGCKISGCELVGGETAEMPGTYEKDKFDLAGFSVGLVAKKKIINKKNVKEKNIILAIPSSGIHSNGYSLVRSIIKNKLIDSKLKTELLKPTKIYTNEIMSLTKNRLINSAAHITGGGLVENLRRSIPDNLSINIDLSKIKVTNIFKWLKKNQISESEMLTTFNCGVGFCITVDKKNINKIKRKFSKKYRPYEIGYVSKESNKDNLFNKIKW